jgi:hypothetical protein
MKVVETQKGYEVHDHEGFLSGPYATREKAENELENFKFENEMFEHHARMYDEEMMEYGA